MIEGESWTEKRKKGSTRDPSVSSSRSALPVRRGPSRQTLSARRRQRVSVRPSPAPRAPAPQQPLGHDLDLLNRNNESDGLVSSKPARIAISLCVCPFLLSGRPWHFHPSDRRHGHRHTHTHTHSLYTNILLFSYTRRYFVLHFVHAATIMYDRGRRPLAKMVAAIPLQKHHNARILVRF